MCMTAMTSGDEAAFCLVFDFCAANAPLPRITVANDPGSPGLLQIHQGGYSRSTASSSGPFKEPVTVFQSTSSIMSVYDTESRSTASIVALFFCGPPSLGAACGHQLVEPSR